MPLDKPESTAIQFGDDWPGLFIESDHAKSLAFRLNSAYESKDKLLMHEIVSELDNLLDRSNVKSKSGYIVLKMKAIEPRIESGHVLFNNGAKGYFLRGDHAYMMKLGINSFVRDRFNKESNSHIPFLINECRHWSK